MQVVLLRVGIDTGAGGISGPLLADDQFEFVPIPDGTGIDERTYGNTWGRHERRLIDYFPARLQLQREAQAIHVDPEFETFTYGDPTPPKRGLRRLQSGDLLVFYAGLEPWPEGNAPAALYFVGYFDVILAGLATEFSDEEISEHFSANAHVRHPSIFWEQRDRLVLVKGGPRSRLLDAAVLISETASDRSGRPLKVLSRSMRGIFGDFDGHVSIQRSPPRWVATEFTDRAAEFVRALR